MIHHVNEQLWIDFNLETAVFLDHLAYWLKKNAANKQSHNFQDGRYWTYNTLDAYCSEFPGWSKDTIRYLIRKCVKNGLLIVGNYNRKGYDRTSWYTFTDKSLEYYPKLASIMKVSPDSPDSDSCGTFPTSCGEIPTAIPKLLPSSSNNTITAKPSSDPILREMIDAYRETFPDNPQPHKTAISTNLEKTMRTLIKRWPEIANGEAFTVDWFKRYLRGLKELAPKFSLKSYLTQDGREKKNDLLTFCRWNTVVSFSEDRYS